MRLEEREVRGVMVVRVARLTMAIHAQWRTIYAEIVYKYDTSYGFVTW